MQQELIGLEYLKKNEIENMTCDMNKPFAFISYSHDDHDSQIVRNVFKILYNKGINIWIDTANLPLNEDGWKTSAVKALMSKNCKFAFFFRSESSMVKKTIATELETIKKLKHIESIVAIDIWHDANNNAEKFHDEILNGGNYDDYEICDRVCKVVSTECNALRLSADLGNDISQLANNMYEVSSKKLFGSILPQPKHFENGVVDSNTDLGVKEDENSIISSTENEKETDKADDIIAPDNNEKLNNCGDCESEVGETEGYIYKIFGKEYRAGKGEQAKLMYDAFGALMEKYPQKVGELTKLTSVSRVETVTKPNTKDAMPTYFIACERFTVGGQAYFVGTSYNFDAKLTQIRKMFEICEGTASSFELISPQKETGNKGNGSKGLKDGAGSHPEGEAGNGNKEGEGYIYKIYGKEYQAGKGEQAKLMYDAFRVLMEKYPQKVEELTKLTSVSRAGAVIKPNTKDAMPTYFIACERFTVGGQDYFVGTSYDFNSKLTQIRKMFEICEGTASSFELIFSQKKASHSNKGKKGLGEFLND